MATAIPQGKSQLLTLPRILIVVSVVCFFALLAAARPVFSRVAPATTTTQAAEVDAQAQPGAMPSYKSPKPRAGKPKAVRADD
jgi:hypothetical protein